MKGPSRRRACALIDEKIKELGNGAGRRSRKCAKVRGGLDGFHPRCSGAQFQGQEQAEEQSFGTCLISQTVRRRGPEVAAEGRSVLIAEETAMSMERSDGGLA